jgi:outer membrane protein
MNSKINLYFNSVLSVAIIFLFILHFSSNNTDEIVKDNKPEKENLSELPIKVTSNTNLKIAFVNSDTVAMYYDFAKTIQEKLLSKQSSAERQVKTKYAEYQNLVNEYQKAAEIMGQNEAAEKGQRIALLEQEIMQLEQTLSQNLASQEQKETKEYVEKTDVYMQIIGKELGYDYVLSYRVGGPMLFANPKFDITKQVIELLNKEYSNK